MSRFIPVDPEKWAAMVKAQSDLIRYKEICDELDAECTRLKDENARLRSFCTRTIIPNIDLEKENASLKAQVERLAKAGDAMLSEWASGDEKDAQNFLKALVIWNAAKEGKQSQ
jgi:hypothetical protein